MHCPLTKRRAAFTLVELMVVITLMLVVVGMAAMLIPRISSDQQSTRAAAQLQQWIEIAKQRAARDRVPRGIRLLPGTSPVILNKFPALGQTYVTDLVFLVQADDYYLGSVQKTLPAPPFPANTKTAVFSRATLTNNQAIGPTSGIVTFDMYDPTGLVPLPLPQLPRSLTNNLAAPLYPVLQNDHIVFNGGSTVYKINNVTSATTLTTTSSPKGGPFPQTMVPSGAVLDASFAAPIVIKVASTSLLSTGQSITIAGVLGNFAANGIWTITVIDATHFSLNGSAGNNSYTSGGTYMGKYQTTQYTIMRQPRPDGDEPLQMPQNIIIDTNLVSTTNPNYLPNPPFPVNNPVIDIMFAPDGRVIGSQAAYDKLIFWVRDVTVQNLNEADPTLVVIYTRTGLVAAYQVDTSSYDAGTNTFLNDPYTYTQTGVRSSE